LHITNSFTATFAISNPRSTKKFFIWQANKHIEMLSCHDSVVQIMKDDNLSDTARKDIT